MGLRNFIDSELSRFYDWDFDPTLFDKQSSAMSCAVSCQHSIIEDLLHQNLDEDVTAFFATNEGLFYYDSGTAIADSGGILERLGWETDTGRASLQECLQKIQQGYHPIVAIDPSELYGVDPVSYNDSPPTVGHAIRLLGLDPENPALVQIMDPGNDQAILSVDPDRLEAARQDYDFSTTFARITEDQQEVIQRVKDSLLDHDPQQLELWRTFRSLWDDSPHLHDVVLRSFQEGSLGIADFETADVPEDARPLAQEIQIDVENLLATGGYLALMDFYKDNPDKAKRVTKYALAVGAFDALTEFDNQGVSLDFEINPLLIASLSVYLTRCIKIPQGTKCAKLVAGTSLIVSKGMKVIEYGGYAAVALTAIDIITDIGLTGELMELLDSFDFLGIISDGADGVSAVEGLATLGLGILASRAARWLFKMLNQDDIQRVKYLTQVTSPKLALANLINGGAPPALLLGPYCEVRG